MFPDPQQQNNASQKSEQNQLPPVQPPQSNNTQPSSFNPLQQMQYEPEAKPKSALPLVLTIGFIILLAIGVFAAIMLMNSNKSAQTSTSQVSSDTSQADNTEGQASTATDSTDDSNSQRILDTTAVVQDFYDNYLATLHTSQPKKYLATLHSYVAGNQDLTTDYASQLSKATSLKQDPLLMGQSVLPSKLTYGEPSATAKDSNIVTLPVSASYGAKTSTIIVTLVWQTSQTQSGVWQISKATSK